MTRPVPRARVQRAAGAAALGILAACATPHVADESWTVGETAPTTLAETTETAPATETLAEVYGHGLTDHAAETRPTAAPQVGGRRGNHQNFNVLLGMRFLDDDLWNPLEDQPVLGFEFDTRSRNSILGFEAGLASAYDWDQVGSVDLDTWTLELYAGPRLTFGDSSGTVHPYVGGGISWFYTELETTFPVQAQDDDDSFAGYAHAGVYFNAGAGTNVGVDVRGLFGSDLTLFGGDFDGDYYQIALILGGGW